ncbi:MAG: permease-like cell division protein FtsX [Lachnospiraceae bacterium]|nr:permease-like cell division protein FtsX [Lachnospiraceae bacterium]MDE6252510.1 permease-like cell division protein FtsX [Lachnospiraceae bacterium]
MKISTFLYCLNQGIKNIRRNKLFSLASVGTIAACIFMMGIMYSVIANFQHMVSKAGESVIVTVFFEPGISSDKITLLQQRIEQRSEVAEVSYTSAEQAWEDFKKDYFASNPDLAEGFKDDNPLANSAYFEIRLSDVSMQPTLVSFLESQSGIRLVNYSDVTASALTDFAKMVGYVSMTIVLVLLAVGVFLISNTVMIGIAVRKEEIKIMKLIGATDYFVRAPFIVEGIVIGIVGAAIPLFGLYFVYQKVISYLMGQFQIITGKFSFLSVKEVFSIMTPMALIIGGGIGLLGSIITIRKHLKV